MRSIVRWCLEHRSVVLLAAVLIVLAGGLGATQLRQQFFPDADLPFLVTSIEAPGLDAQQVDEQIAVPIEAVASGLGDVEGTTTTANEGRLTMLTELAYGTDADEAKEELQAALDPVPLPAQAESPTIEGGFTDQAILNVALSTDGRLVDLTEDAEDLQEDLEEIDGVDRVEIEGGAERQFEIQLRPGAIEAGQTPSALASTIEAALAGQPVGIVEGRDARTPLEVAAVGVEDARDLRSLPIGGGDTVGDVASVRSTDDLTGGFARTNARPSVSLSLFKEDEADEVSVIEEAQGLIAGADARSEDFETTTIFETATDVRKSIDGLLLEGGLGALFAVVVIFFFLRSPRATIVAAVSIPTSLVFGLLAASLLGLTINVITLAGLTIAVGRVIDDAIVVLENIYKHLERGEPRMQAAISGTSEVASAIASSTLATVAVFLPLGVVGGFISEIFFSFSVIVATALLASLLVSVTLVPVLAATLLRPMAGQRGGQGLARVVSAATRIGLRFRLVTIGVAVALFAGTIAIVAGGAVPIQFLPDSGTQQMIGEVDLPSGTTTDRAERRLRPLEEQLAADTGVRDFQVSYGDAGLAVDIDDTGTGGTLFASFDESADVQATVDRLREFGGAEYPDGFSAQQVEEGPPTGEFEAVVKGDSRADVRRAATQLTDLLEGRTDVTEVQNEADRRRESFVLDVRGGQIGTPEAAGAQAALAGIVPPADAGLAEDDVPIVVQAPARLVDDPKALQDLPLPASSEATASEAPAQSAVPPAGTGGGATPSGAPAAAQPAGAPAGTPPGGAPPPGGQPADPAAAAPAGAATPGASATGAAAGAQPAPAKQAAVPSVGDVGRVDRRETFAVQSRVDGEIAATVSARLLSEDVNRTNQEIQDELAALELSDAEVEIGGDQEFVDDMFSDLGLAMLAAIALVYVVLLLFFGSIAQPITILAPILFSTVGSLLALVITQQALGLPAMIGQLLLIGIVVANSILVVDTAIRQRRRGADKREAVIAAARLRARPVFMTAVATIAALMPLAIGLSGEGGIISRSLGTVVIGGLLIATLLTLVIVPAVFTIFDRGPRADRNPYGDADGNGDSAATAERRISAARSDRPADPPPRPATGETAPARR